MKDYFETHYKEYLPANLTEHYRLENARFKNDLGEILSTFDRNVHILDLGCGVGNFLSYLDSESFENVAGIDTSEESVKICKENFSKYRIHNKSAQEALEGETIYDVISMFSLLEHIEKHQVIDLLSKIKSRLNTDRGVFLFSTPNMDILIGNTAGRYGDFTHTIGFTKSSLEYVLKNAGFTEIKIFGTKNEPYNLISWIIFRIYRPIVTYFLKLFYKSMGLNWPSISGNVIYGVCK
jgi:2-polyprenyl-3-methyl-5-hydroxy-6-metoxy-1,4-benzoquinol methylase